MSFSVPYPIISGVVAACGSALGKFATSGNSSAVVFVSDTCNAWFNNNNINNINSTTTDNSQVLLCTVLTYLTRGVLLLALISSNTYALAANLRGMTQMGSFLATVLSTGTNFATSALLGILLFDEKVPQMWWVGAACIGAGTILLGGGSGSASPSDNNDGDTRSRTSRSRSSAKTIGTRSDDSGRKNKDKPHRAKSTRSRSKGRAEAVPVTTTTKTPRTSSKLRKRDTET